MELDDELCLCFHVSKRKVLNYLRIHQPRVPSQLADCGGAGTAPPPDPRASVAFRSLL